MCIQCGVGNAESGRPTHDLLTKAAAKSTLTIAADAKRLGPGFRKPRYRLDELSTAVGRQNGGRGGDQIGS